MTDAEINKAVAERVMGWRPNDTGVVWMRPAATSGTYELNGWAIIPPEANAYDNEGDLSDPWYRFGGTHVFDVCGDPAAWGGLYTWLCANQWEVSLIARGVGTTEARVRHHHARGYFGMAEDAQPGRALALAALKAHGVEI